MMENKHSEYTSYLLLSFKDRREKWRKTDLYYLVTLRGRRSGPKSGGGGAEAGGRDECGGVGVFDKEYPC